MHRGSPGDLGGGLGLGRDRPHAAAAEVQARADDAVAGPAQQPGGRPASEKSALLTGSRGVSRRDSLLVD